MGIKRCPKCGSVKLLAKKITGVQVESIENGEYKINAEGSKYQIEIFGCAKCKEEFDESALVEMVKCKKCGKLVKPENLDTNGECDVCRALEERPDLANMSKEDLIRMMLKLEKNTSNNINVQTSAQSTQTESIQETKEDVSNKAEEKIKIAQAAISNVSNDFTKEIVEEAKKETEEVEEIMNPPEVSEEPVAEKPKRKRGPRKKNSIKESENVLSEQVSEEQVEQSANEISESQEAPFPEQDSELKEAFTESENQQDEQQPQQQFQMFEEEQSF